MFEDFMIQFLMQFSQLPGCKVQTGASFNPCQNTLSHLCNKLKKDT